MTEQDIKLLNAIPRIDKLEKEVEELKAVIKKINGPDAPLSTAEALDAAPPVTANSGGEGTTVNVDLGTPKITPDGPIAEAKTIDLSGPSHDFIPDAPGTDAGAPGVDPSAPAAE